LVSLPFSLLKNFNLGNISFPARNAPNQNIFEPISKIVTAIEVVLYTKFRRVQLRLIPRKSRIILSERYQGYKFSLGF